MRKRKDLDPSNNLDEFRIDIAKRIALLPPRIRLKAAQAALDLLGPHKDFVRESVPTFSDFIKEAWNLSSAQEPYIHNWHIDAISDHLEAVLRAEIKNLVICMPPRFGKSIITCELWPAWCFAVDPGIRMIFASYSQEFADRDGMRTRDIIMSSWYRNRFLGRVSIRMDRRRASWFHTTKGGFRLATSPGGIAIGEGADIFVVDDPHKPIDVLSPSRRKKVIEWWKGTVSTRFRDKNNFRKVVIMQRLHCDDLAGWCIENGYEALILQYEFTGKKYSTSLGEYDPRTKPGEVLWPERLPKELIMKDIKECKLDENTYLAQYQQTPEYVSGQDRIFDKKYLKFWVHISSPKQFIKIFDSVHELKRVKSFDFTIISVDSAVSTGASANRTSMQVWGKSEDCFYLIESITGKFAIDKALEILEELYNKYLPTAVYIENSMPGISLSQLASKKIQKIKMVSARAPKDERASAILHLFISGRVYLNADGEWLNDYINELLEFPNTLRDDAVDATTQALTCMQEYGKLVFA